MPRQRGSKRGRGGRGGQPIIFLEPDFPDDFIPLDSFVGKGNRGRGRGRGAFAQFSSVFVPPVNRGGPRGGSRGAGPSTPARGRGSPVPRGRGDFKPRGRGGFNFRGNTRGDYTPRGRGRGFGYGDRDYGNGTGHESRLLEPIKFVPAQTTPRFLFEEDAEDIFRAEVVDLAPGERAPTADVIEAAFAAQLQDQQGSEDTAGDETDFQAEPNVQSQPTANIPQPSSRELPKLDISSAVSLATALKDAALTPREETFRSTTPSVHNATAIPNLITPITEQDSESGSDNEDVVLFVPQPRTPARSLTPLPLLAAPGPAHPFGVMPSPMRPSPLSASFAPVREEEEPKPDTIAEAPVQIATEVQELVATVEKPVSNLTPPQEPSEPIPVINFEDLSSVMFIDTTPAPVDLPTQDSSPPVNKTQKHILGTERPQEAGSRAHGMDFEFSSSSGARSGPHGSPSVKGTSTSTTAEPTEMPAVSAPRAATPNFHAMTFKFAPRSAASRVRKPPPTYSGHRGLGFKFKGKSPRIPREGDSDLDWGDDGPPKAHEAAKDNVSESDEDPGMLEDVSSADMLAFLKGVETREWVTMDDIKDEEMLRQEDEDGIFEDIDSEESDSEEDEEELNRIIAEAEKELIGSDEEAIMRMLDDDDADSDDVDGSFRTQLNRMRQNASGHGKKGKKGKKNKKKGKGKGKGRMDDDDDDDSIEIQAGGFSWADEDEEFIAHIQEQLEEQLLLKRERKGMISPPLSPASRKKNKDLPPELLAQWERDRQKKAENKRLRALQRQAAALEQPKRGSGSKASFLFNSNPLPNLAAAESRLRSFVSNLEMRTMALPAMDKDARQRVHMLAECFGVKTSSKGSGTGRYITLIRTSRTGIMIDEAKIRWLLRADDAAEAEGGGAAAFNRAYYRRDDGGPGKSRIKTRDGEIVGRAAAKIGEDNIGHKMLSNMGWSEGTIIGKSGGIADPLVAVMKRTKLGLGATYK